MQFAEFKKQYAQAKGLTATEAEKEILEILNYVAYINASDFLFPGTSIEDLKSEAKIAILERLDKYDFARPLKAFAWTVAHNALYNLKRSELGQPKPPCNCCAPTNPPPSPCLAFSRWAERNRIKHNLCTAIPVESIVGADSEPHAHTASDPVSTAIANENHRRILVRLPRQYQDVYLDLIEGRPVQYHKRQYLREIIRNISVNLDP